MIQFTKILYKGETLQLVWQKQINGHTNVYSLKTKVEPHPDFMTVLRSMDKHICIESELPQGEAEYNRHDVHGATFAWEEDEFGSWLMSASLISDRFMTLADENMKIVTPLKPETSDSGGIPLEVETVKVLYRLIEEAEKYMGGKRYDLFAQVEAVNKEVA